MADELLHTPHLLEVFRREFEALSGRLEQAALALVERPPADGASDAAEAALRALHSLKGNCQLMRYHGMATLAHAAEEVIGAHRAAQGRAAWDDVGDALLEVNDELRVMLLEPTRPAPPALVDTLERLARATRATPIEVRPPPVEDAEPAEPAAPAEPEPEPAPTTERTDAIAVPARTLATLFDLAEWARSALLAAADARSPVAPAAALGAVEALGRGLLAAQKTAVATLIPKLRRLVRETARAVGKQATLSVGGESLLADIPVIDDLATALPHLLRNALDHGVEPPDERRALHKPATARLQLVFTEEAGELVASVADDGRGLDPDVLAARAVERGVITAEAAAQLTLDERLRLVLAPGFSTRDRASTVSGRGVGLDVVAQLARRRGGRVDVEGRPGAGARFELRFPLASRWEDLLVVALGSRLVGVPVGAVAEVLPLEDAPTPRNGLVERATEALPLIGIAALDPRFGEERARPTLILDVGGTRLALAVDALVGLAGTVVLAAPAPRQPYVAGLGRTPTGEPLFCLDAGEIARTWNALTVPEE